jgi:spore coat protein U-like protein
MMAKQGFDEAALQQALHRWIGYEAYEKAVIAKWKELYKSGSGSGGGCTPGADQIALFIDINFSGQCVVKGVGNYSNPSAIGLPNDSISSIRVGSNVKATLCRDDNYGGGCETFTGDDSDLRGNSIGNDQVSAAKVETRSSGGGGSGGPSGYTFCANENQRCSFSGTKDVAYGANGRFNYKYGVTGGIDCNNGTFGDPISGVVKACYTKDSSGGGGGGGGGSSCSPNADQIALFVDVNYSGQCVIKGVGTYTNPGAIGLPNDSISSIKVGGNVKATLCRDDNYGGGCETFTGDDSDLRGNSIGNDQVSSAKVETRSSGGGGGGPSGYTFCTSENQRCNFSGAKDVAYGANGKFNYKYGVTGGIDCNNGTFGDPIVGTVKACYTKDSSSGGGGGGPSGYTFCANENQRCSFSGTKDVAYGANGKFNYKYGVTGGIDCNNSTFGDPIVGTVKACYIR